MDDLVGRLVANAGVDRTVAETTDGSVLRFPLEEESAEKLRRRVRNRPGAETAIPASTSVRGGPRVRDPIGGPASTGRRMMIAGPTPGPIRAVVRAYTRLARELAEEDAVGEIAGAIPGRGRSVMRLAAPTAGRKRGEIDVLSHHRHR